MGAGRFAAAILAAVLPAMAADTILVLPLFNLSDQETASRIDWVGESISEAIREALAAEGLLVLGREEREEAYRRLAIRPGARLTTATVIKIAQTLDTARVFYGSYEVHLEKSDTPLTGANLRIRSQLLDLRQMEPGEDLEELGALADLPSIERQLAWRALRRVGRAPSEEEYAERHPLRRLDALESYVRGLLAPGDEQKLRLFAQAARLDETYSQANFAMGRLYAGQEEWRHAVQWLRKVDPGDSRHSEAQFLLGLALYYTAEFPGAAAAFAEVARKVPLNEVFNNLGAAQSRSNQPEAVANFRRALEGDEADPDYHFNLGYALWKQGQFDAAAVAFRAALAREEDDPDATLMLGRCLKQSGPRQGDPRSDGMERIKHNYEEGAYRQLKAELEATPK